MKRLFVVLGVMIISASCAVAEMPDFSGMTQAEILDMINEGRNAIVLEETDAGLLHYDTGLGVTILFTSFSDRSSSRFHYLNVVIVNDTDTDYVISCNSLYINGWKCESLLIPHINAHRRMNDEWGFVLEDANLDSVDQISEIEMYLKINPEGRTREIVDLPPVVIVIEQGD